MRSSLVLLAASSLAVLAAACGSDSSGPKIGPPSQVSVLTSPTASGTVKTSVGAFGVKVADANGNAVSGIVVNFFATGGGGITFAPSSATSDASGIATTTVTLGTKTGSVQLTAYATGVSTPASATVTATPGPLVSLVTTPKSLRLSAVGDTARITYLLHDEFANAVTGATLAFAIADPTLVSVDATGLVKALRAGGATTIAVSSGGRSDTVAVSVLAPGATACTGVVAPSTLPVGAVVAAQGANICLTGDATAGSEYTVVGIPLPFTDVSSYVAFSRPAFPIASIALQLERSVTPARARLIDQIFFILSPCCRGQPGSIRRYTEAARMCDFAGGGVRRGVIVESLWPGNHLGG